MDFYLGVDMGTSSIKATVADEECRIIDRVTLPSELINPRDGFYEVDPVETWWKGFTEICLYMGQRMDLENISGICISSVCGSFVPVSKDLDPMYNAVLYGIDRRSEPQVERMNFEMGEYLASNMGGLFTTHSVIPKILWFRENLPEIYDRTAYFVESNNFVSSRLTGTVKWDYPTAAGSKMVDFKNLALPAPVMERYSLDSRKLPPFGWPVNRLGTVTPAAAAVTGLKAGTPVAVGGCDVNAEAMSLRAVHPGDMILVFGSTLSILLTTDRYAEPEGFVPGMSLLENTYRIGAATSSGGKYLKWFRERLDCHRGENITPSNIPTGIMILPYLDGARTPFNDPEASLSILGLKSGHSGLDIYRGAMESLGYELDLLFRKMAREYPLPAVIDVTGGLSNDLGLMKTISDITGRNLRIHRGVDASFGDALLAMMDESDLAEIEIKKGMEELAAMQEYVEPDLGMSKLYEPLRNKYRRICGPVMEIMKA